MDVVQRIIKLFGKLRMRMLTVTVGLFIPSHVLKPLKSSLKCLYGNRVKKVYVDFEVFYGGQYPLPQSQPKTLI